MNYQATGTITARDLGVNVLYADLVNPIIDKTGSVIATLPQDHWHYPNNTHLLSSLGFENVSMQITFNSSKMEPKAFAAALKTSVNGSDLYAHALVADHADGHSTVFIGGNTPSELIEKIYSSNRTDMPVLNKRDYYIDWASYSFNNSNHDIATKWYNDREEFFIYERTDEGAANWVSQHMSQKLCVSLFDPGLHHQIDNADERNNANAMHGEVYWNAYGGIDGFCNDWNDDT